jgi:hypothetical protein
MVLQLILLLVGLQVAMAATVMRLAVARTGAMVKAERLAEAGVALAAEQSSASLAAVLAAGGDMEVATGALAPSLPPPRVRILDDQDGDGDPLRDSNGRVLLSAEAEVSPFPATAASRAGLVREALVGGWLPLPAALVDCAGGLAVCGGDEGCPVPGGQINGAGAAAVAVPEVLAASLRRKLFILAREVLRGALGRCGDPAVCAAADDEFLRAAATGVLRRLENPAAVSLGLTGAEVGRLVGNLVLLEEEEAGPGSIVWWDGSGRAVAEMADLVAVVNSLSRAAGHVPSLSGHPYPSVLTGTAEWSMAGDFCARLPLLLAAATESFAGTPPGGAVPGTGWAVTIISQARLVAAGENLSGEGLLVLRAPVMVRVGGRLEWRGSVILAGGALAGEGQVEIQGSLLLAPATAAPLDLSWSGLILGRDPDLHRRAWDAAGTVLVSTWFAPFNP